MRKSCCRKSIIPIEQIYAGSELRRPAQRCRRQPKLGLEDPACNRKTDFVSSIGIWSRNGRAKTSAALSVGCGIAGIRKGGIGPGWFSPGIPFAEGQWYRNGEQDAWRSLSSRLKRREDFWYPKGMKPARGNWKSLPQFR